jgi:uncharacterized protein YukE
MGQQPNVPERPEPRWLLGLVLAVAVMAVIGFMWQRNTASSLAAENQKVNQALQQTQNQLDQLKSKIDALTLPATPIQPIAHKESAMRDKPAAAFARRHSGVTHTTAVRQKHHAVDDPRWKQMQSRMDEQGKLIDAHGKVLDEQGKAIEGTRQDLTAAKTELSGSIARTHGELVALERKGERSYFEFDIQKTKQFRATGPVGVKLKKANTKHQYADLDLMVDDANLSKKHVNLLEPVIFYAAEGGRPVELVINAISKDHIHGYVSTPKYKQSELAAMSASAETNTQGSDQPPARQKLELPKN